MDSEDQGNGNLGGFPGEENLDVLLWEDAGENVSEIICTLALIFSPGNLFLDFNGMESWPLFSNAKGLGEVSAVSNHN